MLETIRPVYSVSALALALSRSQEYIRRQIRAGKLTASKPGGKVLVISERTWTNG